MKNEQQQQAKNLYFQTNLSKTEIARQLGINRRTVMLWCHQGNWDNLRQSSRHMPSIMAERCYLLIGHLTQSLLQRDTFNASVSNKEADAIHKLACSIKKLKTRNTVNESMEMFNYFLAGVQKKDPAMADAMMPFIEEYIKSRTDVTMLDHLSDEYTEHGTLPYPEKEIMENWQDEKDWQSMAEESQLLHTHPNPRNITKDDITAAALSSATTIDLTDPIPQTAHEQPTETQPQT